jgi:glycosyltransferase involved in cell wall biosynthesis
MKIHTVFITYNRLHLTEQAIDTYLNTVSVPFTYVVMDNCSDDGTKEWLNTWDHPYESFTRNMYPGFACNRGWERAPDDATHLHRADNDFVFRSGWCKEVERCFVENPMLGQLGMRTNEQEDWNGHNVGGNNIIRRELWDAGLRYDERPWPEIKTVGYSEDSFMSPAVARMGWEWGRVEKVCIQPIGEESPDDDYYKKSWADRKIVR